MNVLLIESSELLRERYTRILSSVTEVKTLTIALNSKKSIDIIDISGNHIEQLI